MDKKETEMQAVEKEKLENVSGGNTRRDYELILKKICPICGTENMLEPLAGGWHCTYCNHNIWL